MTRKKFIKQLMAMGYDRNEANAAAWLANAQAVPYQQRLEEHKLHMNFVQSLENIGKAFQGVVTGLAEIGEKFGRAMAAFSSAWNDSGGGADE